MPLTGAFWKQTSNRFRKVLTDSIISCLTLKSCNKSFSELSQDRNGHSNIHCKYYVFIHYSFQDPYLLQGQYITYSKSSYQASLSNQPITWQRLVPATKHVLSLFILDVWPEKSFHVSVGLYSAVKPTTKEMLIKLQLIITVTFSREFECFMWFRGNSGCIQMKHIK